MEINFFEIPSTVEINKPKEKYCTVADEIRCSQMLFKFRKTVCKKKLPFPRMPHFESSSQCEMIRDSQEKPRATRPSTKYMYRFVCVCPQYRPKYSCEHVNKVIIDRDVLTREEHLQLISTPTPNYGAARKGPFYYTKRIRLPSVTARIEKLAVPTVNRMKENLEAYGQILGKQRAKNMQRRLAETRELEPDEVKALSLQEALNLIREERRLQRIARMTERRRCNKMKKNILKKQRRQIRKIICVLFEEMRDFFLSDQFKLDDQSSLSTVILEQLKQFTEKDFYTTNNLREYQSILANNIGVWINKFISNLNICLSQQKPSQPEEPMSAAWSELPDPFLPIEDYISCPEGVEEEYFGEEEGFGEELDQEIEDDDNEQ